MFGCLINDGFVNGRINVKSGGIAGCNGGYSSFEGGCVDGGGGSWIYDTSAQEEEGGQSCY